jgi:tetratricopeptide (TPR) repeat protein
LSTLYQRLGDLYVRAGNLDKAGEQFQQDLAIREKLAAANPERDEWQQYLANAYNRMGDLRLQEKQPGEALGWYRKALAIRERLAPTVAANADWQSLLAGEHVKIARALVQDGKKEEGAESYQKAIAIFQRLVELDPGKVSWEQMTTIALNEMARVLAEIEDRIPDAIAALRQAVTIQTKLVAVNPEFMPRRWNLALTYERLGDLLLDTKQREEALVSFVHASELLEQLTSDERDGRRSKRLLSDLYVKAGSLLDWLGRRADAIAFYRKCFGVREELAALEPQETWWRIGAAIALIRLGELGDDPDPRFTRALAMLEDLDAAGKLPEQRKLWLGRARGKVALIHSRQARAALYAGHPGLALDEILGALKLDPSNAYSVLWLHIIRARKGDDDRDELATNAARLDSATWPWPVVALFNGTKTPERGPCAARHCAQAGKAMVRTAEIVIQFSCAAAPSHWWQIDYSQWICRLTHSPFSHVDLVLPEGLLGASDHPTAPLVKTDPPGAARGVALRVRDYQVFRIRRNATIRTVEEKAQAFRDFCWSQLGMPFDNGALKPSVFLSPGFQDRDWRTPGAWYCAELMTRALEVSGVLNWPILAVKNRITAADLLLIINPLIDAEAFRAELPYGADDQGIS